MGAVQALPPAGRGTALNKPAAHQYRTADPSEAFAQRQIDAACDALPTIKDETQEARAARREDARTLFATFGPRNPIEEALAAQAVLAHFTAMAMYARAGEPDRAEPDVMHIASAARAEARSFKTSVNDLENRHVQAVKAEAAETPEPALGPIPKLEIFQPRDRYGQPI